MQFHDTSMLKIVNRVGKTLIFIIMMKLFTIILSVILFSFTGFSQYSNVSLNGPWLTYTDNDAYMLFDGNGNITEFGVFGGVTGSNVGTYNVASNGSITGNLALFGITFTGQLLAVDTGYLNVLGMGIIPIYKVHHPGALTDTLTGTFVNDSNSTTKNVVFIMNADGQIINSSGSFPGVSGRIYTENGIFAGFIKTTDSDNCYNQIMISGNYSGNLLSGTMSPDCNIYGGTVSLTRSGQATLIGILSFFTENNFSVFPNPFTESIAFEFNRTGEVSLRLIDVNGKIVFSGFVNDNVRTLHNLSSLEKGVYLLEIFNNEKVSSIKLIKK